jgi:hypothetical protein
MENYFECPICGSGVVDGYCVDCDYVSDMTDDEIEAYQQEYNAAFSY